MKTFQITITSESDSKLVMDVLQDLQNRKLIEIKQDSQVSVLPSYEQIEEIIDESEIGPYYTQQEAKEILHL
jgi:hypothetical protein